MDLLGMLRGRVPSQTLQRLRQLQFLQSLQNLSPARKFGDEGEGGTEGGGGEKPVTTPFPLKSEPPEEKEKYKPPTNGDKKKPKYISFIIKLRVYYADDLAFDGQFKGSGDFDESPLHLVDTSHAANEPEMIKEYVSKPFVHLLDSPVEEARTVGASVEALSYTATRLDGTRVRGSLLEVKGNSTKELGNGFTDSLFQEIREDEATEFTFTMRFAPAACAGSYEPVLYLTVLGGRLGDLQMSRLAKAIEARQIDGPDGKGYIGQAEFPEQGGSNIYVYTFPKMENKKCGNYQLQINISSDLPLGFQQNPIVAQVRDQQNTTVEFAATLNFAGGGPPPAKKKQEEQPPRGEGAPSEEGEGLPQEEAESYPFSGLAPEMEEGELDQQGILGATEADLLRQVAGGRDLRKERHVLATPPLGPPWTLMDLIVNPSGSLDATSAVDLHDIEGRNAVRGLFDGRVRGFIPEP